MNDLTPLSVKQMRENFPWVRSQLAEGKGFMLIYRSRVIANLLPTESEYNRNDSDDENQDNLK